MPILNSFEYIFWLKKWLSEIKKKSVRREAESQLLEAEGGVIDFGDEADCASIVAAARGLEGAR